MQHGNLDDLSAFLIVAREGSFTKAAAKLGVSQSALSYTIKELEARLKLRLLTRTTRSVSPTAAGERLLRHVGPRLEEIAAELAALNELREKPSGTIRITATEYATSGILLPKLAKLLPKYPDIKVEIISDYGLTDIVAQRFDAGVRDGEQVAKDMIAVRIAPDARMAIVGTPSYFRSRSEPNKPQELVEHNCINLRLPTYGGLYAWEFAKGKREMKVRSASASPTRRHRAGGSYRRHHPTTDTTAWQPHFDAPPQGPDRAADPGRLPTQLTTVPDGCRRISHLSKHLGNPGA